MKTKNLLLIAVVLFGFAITSCKKDKVKGCTTTSAKNFNSKAEEDDGSCQYEGSVVFWTNSLTSGESWNIYLNGLFQGNMAVNFASAPSCGNTGALTIKKSLGSNKSQPYNISAAYVSAGTTGPISPIGTVTFEANTCTSIEF